MGGSATLSHRSGLHVQDDSLARWQWQGWCPCRRGLHAEEACLQLQQRGAWLFFVLPLMDSLQQDQSERTTRSRIRWQLVSPAFAERSVATADAILCLETVIGSHKR